MDNFCYLSFQCLLVLFACYQAKCWSRQHSSKSILEITCHGESALLTGRTSSTETRTLFYLKIVRQKTRLDLRESSLRREVCSCLIFIVFLISFLRLCSDFRFERDSSSRIVSFHSWQCLSFRVFYFLWEQETMQFPSVLLLCSLESKKDEEKQQHQKHEAK